MYFMHKGAIYLVKKSLCLMFSGTPCAWPISSYTGVGVSLVLYLPNGWYPRVYIEGEASSSLGSSTDKVPPVHWTNVLQIIQLDHSPQILIFKYTFPTWNNNPITGFKIVSSIRLEFRKLSTISGC